MVNGAAVADKTIDFAISKISNYVETCISEHKWKRLFENTGVFLAKNTEASEEFERDLKAVFAKENMDVISKKLKDKNGYEIASALREELTRLMETYEIDANDAQTYIHFFMESVLYYISQEDRPTYMEAFLSDWRTFENSYFEQIQAQISSINKILGEMDKDKRHLKSYIDIDSEIRKKADVKGLTLDFFEVDDEEFEDKLRIQIGNPVINIVGNSKEETLFRVLKWLKDNYKEKVVLVAENEDTWKKLDEEKITDKILIPFFRGETIDAIPGNTVIFIFSEEEPCYRREKIVLRKRTRRNLIEALERIGMDHQEAYLLCENTHGLYTPLSRKLYRRASFVTPEWARNCNSIILTALLCGMWSESDGDKLVLEDLSGVRYDDFIKELQKYTKGDTPFVMRNEYHGGITWQLGSVEDAWEEIDRYVTKNVWDKFIDLLYEVLIETEPLFEYPFEKHFEASIYAKKPLWSRTLKHGMIRTLTMRAYYRMHQEQQHQIDGVVKNILDTIKTKEQWGYIAQFMKELCEASPKAVIDKLEKSFGEDSAIKELFSVNDRGFVTGRNYYTHILWAVEQLLFQKQYAKRAIEWLWKMDSLGIKYNISNSPKSTLEEIFCAWVNLTPINASSKMKYAEEAINKYPNAWDILYTLLPGGKTSICATISKPRYRDVDEPEVLYTADVNRTFIKYFDLCVDYVGDDIDRWLKMISSLDKFSEKKVSEFLSKIIDFCNTTRDENRILIKNKLREEIHRHRYYCGADWAMCDGNLELYEKTMNSITVTNPLYDYVYLFTSKYAFPLLNPVPFDDKNSFTNRDKNEFLIEKEIQEKISEFKANGYSIIELVKLASQMGKNQIGEILAKYFSENHFDKNLVCNLIILEENKCVYEYVRFFVYKGTNVLKDVINVVAENSNNDELLLNLISLEVIESKEALIANAPESIKKKYWSFGRHQISIRADKKTIAWAIKQCHEYGTVGSFLELLFDLRENNVLSKNEIYENIFLIEDMSEENYNQMTDYYLTELLNIVQNEFVDTDKQERIASLEWKCRNVLDWNQMVCLQRVMKLNPKFYAELVFIIYRSDSGEFDEKKSELANRIYGGFDKAKFCPTEKNGRVDYEEFCAWICQFKELLKNNNQLRLFDHLIGRLLPYAPEGEDGIVPCEAVRRFIEDNVTEKMKNSFIVEEENRWGVHVVDGGKSERARSEKYKKKADSLIEAGYPQTADIFMTISDNYRNMADEERRRAEDEW